MGLAFGEFTNQFKNFAWFSVATCLEFGVEQCIVYCYLVTASLGRDKGNAFDIRLNVVKQFICQAYSPVSKVSDGAVGDGYF